ncbi:hypothetical protein [Streptomyces sp. NPDC090057]|uniref:hypothetical protein n=1 Tax=Streptomyces sp. NPDC090057 TaxID=3365935 RepID=UPI003824B6CB
MLSYLAAALPEGTSSAPRLLALQCALRMNTAMRVRLPKGILRSLRLDSSDPWDALEHARWLRIRPGSTGNEIVAELLDATLLGQIPARPDRTQAADWALRLTTPSATGGAADPQLRLVSLYLTAHADPETRTGMTELDEMSRACATPSTRLLNVLEQLAVTGPLKSWEVRWLWGDLHWTLACHTAGQKSPTPADPKTPGG